MTFKIIQGDALYELAKLERQSVDCVFTSPEPPFNYEEMQKLVAIMLEIPRV
jgi:DNA modification methylase